MIPSTRYMHLSPIFQTGAFSSAHENTLENGTQIFPSASLLLKNGPETANLLSYINTQRVTLLVVVPTILNSLMAAWVPAGSPAPSELQLTLNSGGALKRSLRYLVSELLPHVRIVGAYSMKERASSMTFRNHTTLPEKRPFAHF